MKKSRFSEEQIIRVLQEVEAGQPIQEVCRKHGISDQSYYNWKAKYGGMTVSEAKRLRVLESSPPTEVGLTFRVQRHTL